MTTPNLSIAHLEDLLAFAKKKLALSLDLEKIEKEIAEFFEGQQSAPIAKAPTRRGRPPGRRKFKAAVKAAPSESSQPAYGSQKEKILAVLKGAGVEGLSVAEVAAKIGAKKTNLNPWFYTAGKKAGVTKVARGRFVFAGKNADAVPAEVSKAPARRGRPPGKKAPTGKIPRGTLKPAILAALSSAGADGLSVSEVADKIGAKKGAVNVWFYTTGKKVDGVKKVAPGRFALKG